MFHAELLNEPAIKKLLRVFQPKEALFEQGDRGGTLYILIDGKVTLHQKTGTTSRVVDTVGPGQILGEKAALLESAYRRTITAVAETETTTLEIDNAAWKMLLARLPSFPLTMARILSQRLERATELIGILQLRNDIERIAHYLLYLARHYGTRTSTGVEISVPPIGVAVQTNTEAPRVEECLALLEQQGILIKTGNTYFLTDENALLSNLATVRERLAA